MAALEMTRRIPLLHVQRGELNVTVLVCRSGLGLHLPSMDGLLTCRACQPHRCYKTDKDKQAADSETDFGNHGSMAPIHSENVQWQHEMRQVFEKQLSQQRRPLRLEHGAYSQLSCF